MRTTDKKKDTIKNSWFYQLFVDNKYISVLIVLILLAILILSLQQIAPIFAPVGQFIQIISLPIVFAAVFYYLTVPLVELLERRGVKRAYGAWLILILIALLIFLLGLLIPSLIDQGNDLVRDWQGIWTSYQAVVDDYLPNEWTNELQAYINHFIQDNTQLSNLDWQDLLNRAADSIGSFVGTVSRIVIAIATAPIILYYMLKDADKLPGLIAKNLPVKIRGKTLSLLKEMNQQISQYIRGQILVAIAVAIMFVIGYQIIGLQYGAIIGVAAGFLNIIPYVGSFLAMIPAFIIAIVIGPGMIIKVAIVFAIEQTIESRVISPLILGNNLQIHPITIMLLLIAGGNMFGVLGVIIIIPVYAVLKVVVTHFFTWYRRVSGLYEDDELKDNIV
ncbi:AI-2E family transporter [Aerococcus kribbianus]|uniref:AI-2E family transporter n=1 Tax=Aerococcus kribbianus TaxID=2999064 RepID=A0A9X3FMI6_9LACT|nr:MULTISPECIES: AI-2E family transporter [unclassified Aerococcus]MCZ0716979.1 AI-2E family transporter [Aerococcus sp. YH-aer221]MCZ0725267.1 AI-2E family transporter [Aerococcus sp. YH-aer222]